jgi:hypothetical protein
LGEGISRINPTGISRRSFTELVAREMRTRLNLKCDFTLKIQTDFPEPKIPVNTNGVYIKTLNWDKKTA